MSSYNIQFSDLIAVQKKLSSITKVTSLMSSKSFSELTGANMYMKLENMQSTGSFKVRGAYNKLSSLQSDDVKNGVVAASAGNHAQGVAYSATKLGIKSTIFMPIFTPPSKVLATKSYGANIILKGESFDDAFAASQEYCQKNNATFIHPFDDQKIIAGQGTVGLEVFDQLPNVEVVFIPIGGGGLISGMAMALKKLNPKIKIIGVEAQGAASMYNSYYNNKIESISTVNTIADGIAVKSPGKITFKMIKEYVDDIILVNDNEIAHTTYLLLQRAKILAEPSGVASVAAAMYNKYDIKGKNVVSIISGGNINMPILEQIIEQGMVQEGLRARIQVIISDQPGELKKILSIFDRLKANIDDIKHERAMGPVSVGKTMLKITLNLQDKNQLTEISKELEKRALECKIIS